MQQTLQDLRYALRSLAKARAFAAVAIVTIGLGLGANTAIFSIVYGVLLKPLPYTEPDRLVMVWQDLRARGGPADEWATPGNYADWRAEKSLFDDLAVIAGWQPTLVENAEPEALAGEQVSHEYFRVLGAAPRYGRGFTQDDDVPGAKPVAIIGSGLWKRRFGGDRAVLGRSVVLSGVPHEIIGIAPEGFHPIVNAEAEIWRPVRLNTVTPARGAIVLRVVARLPRGMSLAAAQTAATALAGRLEAAHPRFNEKAGINLVPLHERVAGDIAPGLVALAGAVAFVLLIACANVANLLLARGASRGRELAVRVALGAGRGRLVRQLLTESVVLAGAGGMFGLLLAVWAVDALIALAPAGVPRTGEISLNGPVLAFAVLLTLGTGVLFGLIPAWQCSRGGLPASLNDSARGGAGTGGRAVRRALIVAEVALALVLLAGSLLLVQTFVRLQAADLGFRTADILVGTVTAPAASYESRDKVIAFYDAVLEQAAAIPGVRQAALSSFVPLSPGDSDVDFEIEGRPAPRRPSETPVTWYRQVSADYFDLLGLRIVRGRGFAAREAAPGVLVNETFARRYFPAEDPIGRRIRAGGDEAPWFTILGIVSDAKGRGAREETRVEAFFPYWQLGERRIAIVLQGTHAASFAPALRQAVSSVDRTIPVVGVRTMDEILGEAIDEPRFLAWLASGFALLALALAAVGIYGVMAYAVSRRTVEIGVRMALGAQPGDVFRLVIGDGLRLTLAGVALGAGGALLAARWLGTLLFAVRPSDPLTLGATAALLFVVALLASFLPAWRAARVAPMVALRAE